MLRIGIAPCTIFTSTKEDYENAVHLSKKYNVNLQTHLSESEFENNYSVKTFKKRPYQYLSDLGWQGERVSFTHCIHINADEIQSLAKTKTNVVHCPISNARKPLGEYGIAPISEMIKRKIIVGIGVDGSAGNDSSNVLEELRWARTLQGTRKESTYLKSDCVLEIGTINGAKLLNWEESIGSLEAGKLADIAIFNLENSVEYVGAQDPVTSLISCQAQRADTVIVNGQIVVVKGELQTYKEDKIIKNVNRFVRACLKSSFLPLNELFITGSYEAVLH